MSVGAEPQFGDAGAPESGGAAGSTMKAAAEEAGAALASGKPITKIVIAIHGMGDQYRQATVKSVITRFGRHFDFPAAVPLGSFYAPDGTLSTFRLEDSETLPSDLGGIGFVEAYWATVPRDVHKEGYTIEESKAWARTIVERVRMRYGPEINAQFGFRSHDYRAIADVLEEMIDTIHVLGNLVYLFEKAGLGKFDLDDLLTAYLGDVQIVTDFANYRAKILKLFRDTVDGVWAPFIKDDPGAPKPEIYLIAHSEGTVVTFMGLLQAMCIATKGQPAPPPRPAWIDHVRGLMTFGSPIDKHLILWPSIWAPFRTPGAPNGSKATAENPPVEPPIRWRNYYDLGDPVGFDLNTVRDWMHEEKHYWAPAFEFEQSDDIGFSRYLLPGVAHNEYWGDRAVFGHFIQNVMGLRPAAEQDFAEPPPSRWWARIGSYIIPYLLAFALLYTGTYLLNKTLQEYVGPRAVQATDAAKTPPIAAPPSNPVQDRRQDAYAVQWWRHLRKNWQP